jgi:hypothetical protein
MADGSVRTPGSGETIASDDIGGVKHQRVKLQIGADGAAVDVPPVADTMAVSGVPPAGLMLWDQTSGLMVRQRSAGQDAQTAAYQAAVAPMLYNGSTQDRQRGNTESTLLSSAARTATTASALQTNHNARGALIIMNVTAASGTGGLQCRLLGSDALSGAVFQVAALPTAVTATGVYCYEFYPGIGAAGGGVVQRTSCVVPRTWQAQVIHGDASSYTYSLTHSLIV